MADQQQAAQIPNLLSLRGARGGRERGRGRGRGSRESSNNEDNEAAKDKIVQQTDQDASGSRMSAVSLGYLDDPFAEAFTPGQSPRRYPIINRGTYVRTTAIDKLVHQFLSTDPTTPKQIISLGAGSDTRYFRLIAHNPSLQLTYHELDFPHNTTSKIKIIKQSPLLLKTLAHPSNSNGDDIKISLDGSTLTSPTYNIHALDLRELVEFPNGMKQLPNLSPTTPTLLLSECCLIYLPPDATVSILSTLTQHFVPTPAPLSIILYEPIRPHDSFGRVMVQNLAQRGIYLQTLHRYSTLTAQKQRLKDAGFVGGQGSADVDFIFEQWVADAERDRVGRCEMLDEIEEWRLLARHYCVVWGWRGGEEVGGDVFGRAWEEFRGQDDEL